MYMYFYRLLIMYISFLISHHITTSYIHSVGRTQGEDSCEVVVTSIIVTPILCLSNHSLRLFGCDCVVKMLQSAMKMMMMNKLIL